MTAEPAPADADVGPGDAAARDVRTDVPLEEAGFDAGDAVPGRDVAAGPPPACAALPDGSPCSDGDPATLGDRCVGGRCLGANGLPRAVGLAGGRHTGGSL